jgi:hypothetical protein
LHSRIRNSNTRLCNFDQIRDRRRVYLNFLTFANSVIPPCRRQLSQKEEG